MYLITQLSSAQKEGGTKAIGGGEKKDARGPTVVVPKMGMHCEGCVKKIKCAIKYMDGMESMKTDAGGNKLTVTEKVDPAQIKSRMEENTKKKVKIVSPQPKKDATAASRREMTKTRKRKSPEIRNQGGEETA